jgi:TonB-linked SusC/RagA family outer membrane protein
LCAHTILIFSFEFSTHLVHLLTGDRKNRRKFCFSTPFKSFIKTQYLMKKCLLKLLVLLLASAPAVAQTVSGRVTTGADGSALPGVSVLVKGTTSGTSTDTDGKYTINVDNAANSVLVFSFIGFATQEIQVGSRTTIDVTLAEDATQLGEVVVTALGIERETKSLTYSAQQVGGDKLTTVRDPNFMNSLSGKVPGLFITRSSSGAGGSVRVILRGQKSTRENQPLYVIDGVPIASLNSAQSGDIWSGRDGGDILSTINPSDIESMTVLKGASASALYGSQGQNGVILITTKKGKAGVTNVDFSSNITVERPMYYPELQYQYGQTSAGNIYSWGAATKSPDHVKPFFQTGTTWINNIALTAGNEKAQTYFSYSKTDNKGILPTNSLDQHTLNFRESAKVGNKLAIDANIMLSRQKVHNRMVGGLYFNPLTGLYLFPRGLDFDQYKEFEYFSPSRAYYLQDWWNLNYDRGDAGQDNQQNPYWILNRNANSETRTNAFASLTLKYSLNNWLTFQARGNINRVDDKYEQKVYASTQGTLADFNGRYIMQKNIYTLAYGDLMLSGDRDLTENIGLTFNVGASIRHAETDALSVDSKGSNLVHANVFSIGAILPSGSMTALNAGGPVSQTQSVFATTTVDFGKKVYADITLRNDWSSTLAFTPQSKKGFFYFSAGVNTILSELVTLPEFISFAKIRASYAKVGNGVAEFSTLPVNTYNAGNPNLINTGTVTPSSFLLPEDHRAVEAGLELRLLNDRFTLDGTYYRTNTYDQFFLIGAPRGSGLSFYTINAGNVQNSGIELAVGYDVIKNSELTWNTNFNFTKNNNEIVELTPLLANGEYAITGAGVNNYGLSITEGGQYGDIYGKKFQRSDGKIVVDATGKPLAASGGLSKLGNPTPDALLGWNNTVNFKGLSVSMLIDARFGGEVMSITQAMLDEYGVSQASADARNAGGVDMPAVISNGTEITGEYSGKLPAETFYTTVGGRAGITEHYMYDATNIRLRELAIGYKLPVQIKFVKAIQVSLIGRNLFFIKKEAPFDPEISMSTGNGVQGVDTFVLPSTRSIGLSVKCSF